MSSTDTSSTSQGQRLALYILIAALVVLGAWTMRHFVDALAWAVILAIATWPWYEKWSKRIGKKPDHWLPAIAFTLLVALVLIVPLVSGAIVAAREGVGLLRHYAEAPDSPITLPSWLAQLPLVGDWLTELWNENFGQPTGAAHAMTQMTQGHIPIMEWTRAVGLQLLRRVVVFAFTLLSLFFVYLHGLSLANDIRRISQRLFGPTVQPMLSHAVIAIRATVDGVVMVAVAEGAIMSAVYGVVGVPHPILFGAITGVLAMVPFAAPIAFGAVALGIGMQGNVAAAIGIIVVGALLLFIVDHFVRPVIIGNAARLPFLWVLLGILGGVESFGLVGLFIGPTLMAALCSLWRDWAQQAADHSPPS